MSLLLLFKRKPIAFDASGSNVGTLSTLTWTHVVGTLDTNRYLLVGVAMADALSQTVLSVDYGGEALALLGSATNGTASRIEIWGVPDPPTGSHTVTVTFSAAVTASGGSSSWYNVLQVGSTGTFVSATGSSSSPSVTASSAAEELVHDVAGTIAASLTVDSSQTQRWNAGIAGITGAGSTENGQASVVMSWTAGAALSWAIGAVPLKPLPISGNDYALEGHAQGKSTATASLTVAHALGGVSAGRSSAKATMAASWALKATATGRGQARGTLAASWVLAGKASEVSRLSGQANIAHSLNGQSPTRSFARAPASVGWSLAGRVSATSGAKLTVLGAHGLAGTAEGSSSASGSLAIQHGLGGIAQGGSKASGSLSVAHVLAGRAQTRSKAQGALGFALGLAGKIQSSSSASGTVMRSVGITGHSSVRSGAIARLDLALGLRGTSAAESQAQATLSALHALRGLSVGYSRLRGRIILNLRTGGPVLNPENRHIGEVPQTPSDRRGGLVDVPQSRR